MDARQTVEAVFTMGPFGWVIVIAAFLVATWQFKKEYGDGNFPGTIVLGFAVLVLASVLITGVTMMLINSRTQNTPGKADTKIGVEQREERR